MERQPLHYDRIHYNGVIHWLETQWNRKLSDHERNILIEGLQIRKADRNVRMVARTSYRLAAWVEGCLNAI